MRSAHCGIEVKKGAEICAFFFGMPFGLIILLANNCQFFNQLDCRTHHDSALPLFLQLALWHDVATGDCAALRIGGDIDATEGGDFAGRYQQRIGGE
jgi:hypothetical protein